MHPCLFWDTSRRQAHRQCKDCPQHSPRLHLSQLPPPQLLLTVKIPCPLQDKAAREGAGGGQAPGEGPRLAVLQRDAGGHRHRCSAGLGIRAGGGHLPLQVRGGTAGKVYCLRTQGTRGGLLNLSGFKATMTGYADCVFPGRGLISSVLCRMVLQCLKCFARCTLTQIRKP